ncbi:MAG: hypothetical protein F7C36_07185 [Desulfurococcales archaeon]|nr:hypothetical protein [Desulfurococcales archaeon]
MEKNCFIDKELFNHDEEELYRALGIDDDEKDLVDDFIEKILGEKTRLSELLESIWSQECDKLSLPGRVYATVRIATEIYSMYLETIARRIEEMEKEKRGEN